MFEPTWFDYFLAIVFVVALMYLSIGKLVDEFTFKKEDEELLKQLREQDLQDCE